MRDVSQKILSVEDAEYFAKRRLPRSMYASIASGSEKEVTLRANLEAFRDVTFRPRAAVHVSERDTSTTVLGHKVALPVVIAPTGNLRIFHTSGEPSVARAAAVAGTIQIVSCFMGYPIEEVVAAAKGPVFFNLYFSGGRENAELMIDRALRAGCEALVITVDWSAEQQKEQNIRQRVDRPGDTHMGSLLRFAPEVMTRPAWAFDFFRDGMRIETPMWIKPDGKAASMWEASASIVAEPPTWEDLIWIREQWDRPIVLKGIIRPDDARRAVDEGAAGIVVSNHGGRALDSSPATLRVLPEIVEALDNQIEVYLDSGIRTGSDVVKAVALGARACLIGRACVWALAAAGEPGVHRILDVFKRGIDLTLGSLGCPSIAALDASYLRVPGGWRAG